MRFKVARHSVRKCDVVEVFADDGEFIGMVTPGDNDDQIRVFSKYLDSWGGSPIVMDCVFINLLRRKP